MTRHFKSLLTLLALPALLAGSCGGGGGEEPVKTESVKCSPESLSCSAKGGELSLEVTASGSFQVYPADGVEWVSVDPPFSSASSARISVKVGENASYKSRSTEITVKCGTTRVKVPLEQAAMEKGELTIDVPEGYHLDWSDEFESGSAPSSSEWWYETGAGGWGNNEIQEYVSQSKDGVSLAEISDGSLKIKAQKIGGKIYSIRINTHRSWTYGWFEARLKLTDAPGAWPAFWMMPKNFKTWPGDGEIDIMEYAISTQGKDRSSSSIHCNAYNHIQGTQKTHVKGVSNAASEFHVYACEWTADEMNFYIDGTKHFSFQNDKKSNYDTWPFYNPFYLKLNLAWGGNMGGATDESALPAVYEIDYVRVFQKD